MKANGEGHSTLAVCLFHQTLLELACLVASFRGRQTHNFALRLHFTRTLLGSGVSLVQSHCVASSEMKQVHHCRSEGGKAKGDQVPWPERHELGSSLLVVASWCNLLLSALAHMSSGPRHPRAESLKARRETGVGRCWRAKRNGLARALKLAVQAARHAGRRCGVGGCEGGRREEAIDGRGMGEGG
jgi:hypothetical protein